MRQPGEYPCRSGSTLVERLAAIGIIGLLIAFLLPALQKARAHAVSVQCACNMRQIAAGRVMYANAHRGTIAPARPPNLGAGQNVYHVRNGMCWGPRWFALLGAQTGLHAYRQPSPLLADENSQQVDNPVFLCPAKPEWTSGRH